MIEKAMGIFLIIITLPVILIVSCDKSSSDEPTFAIEVEGEGNAVSADAKEDQAIFEVFSERGIGAASVVMVTREFPASGILIFHLRGLEEMRFSYQETEVLVSVSSSQGNRVRESVILGSGSARQETPIMPESPYWMGVEILEADGSTGSIPLTNGVIKVSLPEDFLLESQDSFRIQWIDFYR